MTAFSPNATAVAELAKGLLGEPNRLLSTQRELRWGKRGSFALNPSRGVWRDHEAGVGGGVLDLLIYFGAASSRAEAARALEREGLLPAADYQNARQTPPQAAHSPLEAERRRAAAMTLWDAGRPLEGTPGETYLRTARCVSGPLESAELRFLPAAPLTPYRPDGRSSPALVGRVVTDDSTPVGVHLTYLHAGGMAKADVSAPRKMVGRVGGGHIRLIGGPNLVVAEGIESAFSAWEAALTATGVQPVGLGAVAALSAGGVAAFRWPATTTSILIAPDRDESGAGETGAQSLAERAYVAGLHVAFLRSPVGYSDWNDAALHLGRST